MNGIWSKAITISCVAILGAYALAGNIEVTRQTVDGGSATSSAGGGFELSGTIGQPDAGVLSGGGFQLAGGFWFESPPGDCDSDGVTNLADFCDFFACSVGADVALASSCRLDVARAFRCECLDSDGDGDVDLLDFGILQRSFNGNNGN